MPISSGHRHRILDAHRRQTRSRSLPADNLERVQSDRTQLNKPEHSEHAPSQPTLEIHNPDPAERKIPEQPEQHSQIISDEPFQDAIAFLQHIYELTVELFPHLQGESWEEVSDFLRTAEAHAHLARSAETATRALTTNDGSDLVRSDALGLNESRPRSCATPP